jgi:hypothetical protein
MDKCKVIPIFKKGDERDPKNYRGISVLNTSYKIYSKIINKKLKGHLCTDATFCLKLLIEKRREYNFDTHLLFLDYEKAFGSVQRQILFNILEAGNNS